MADMDGWTPRPARPFETPLRPRPAPQNWSNLRGSGKIEVTLLILSIPMMEQYDNTEQCDRIFDHDFECFKYI